MGPVEKSTGIVQFAGSNFDNWKFRVERHLSSVGCIKAVLESAPTDDAGSCAFKRIDAKAQDIIVSFIHDDCLEYVRDKKTAKEMWEALCASFERKSAQNQTLVRKELANLKLREGDEMNPHLLKFDSLIRQLKSAGGKPEEADLVSQLFLTLPESYDAVVTALENLPIEELTVSIVKQRLLSEESKKKQRHLESVEENLNTFTTRTDNLKLNGNFNNRGRNGQKLRKEDDKTDAYPSCSFMANSNRNLNSKGGMTVSFVLDSEATDHCVNNIEMFSIVEEMNEPRQISVAKTGEIVEVCENGVVQVFSNTGVKLNLKNVLYCPSFKENVLSISRIVEAGIIVNRTKCYAQLEKDGSMIAYGKRVGNLFEFKVKISRSVLNISENDLAPTLPIVNLVSKHPCNDLIKHDDVMDVPNYMTDNIENIQIIQRNDDKPSISDGQEYNRNEQEGENDSCVVSMHLIQKPFINPDSEVVVQQPIIVDRLITTPESVFCSEVLNICCEIGHFPICYKWYDVVESEIVQLINNCVLHIRFPYGRLHNNEEHKMVLAQDEPNMKKSLKCFMSESNVTSKEKVRWEEYFDERHLFAVKSILRFLMETFKLVWMPPWTFGSKC